MLAEVEIFQAFQLSVLGYVVCCVLMEEGFLLEWYYDKLVDLQNSSTLGKWVAKPLGLCETCFTGQLALWIYLFINLSSYATKSYYLLALVVLRHFIFIAFAILFVTMIKIIISKWK